MGALTALPLRLYSAVSAGRPKPRSYCDPREISRSERQRLNSLGYLSRSLNGVDDVHEIKQHQLLETLNRPCIDPDTGISYFDRPSWLATHVRYVDICGLSFVKPEDANGRRPRRPGPCRGPPDRTCGRYRLSMSGQPESRIPLLSSNSNISRSITTPKTS